METAKWLDKEKAAGMFLVAWVKEWSMMTLLCTLLGEQVNSIDEALLEEVHKHYPFMPNNLINYFAPYLKRTRFEYVKRFTASNYPKLNEALWNAKDNKEILALKPRVLKLVCPNIARTTKYSNAERAERAKELRDVKAVQLGYQLSRKRFTKGRGNNGWTTTK